MARRIRSLLACGVAGLVVLVMLPAGASAQSRAMLGNSTAAFATSANLVGTPSADRMITFHVNLGWRDQAAVDRLVAQVTDPRSPSYRHFLTPAGFIARFSPKASETDAVSSWLRGQGLSVLAVPKDRLYVRAQGTVAQVERAFQTTIRLYRTAEGTRYATAGAPSVPASLRSMVQGVTGLAQFQAHNNHIAAEAQASQAVNATPGALPDPPLLFRNAPPCSSYWAQKIDNTDPPAYGEQPPYVPCGRGPENLRQVYMEGAGSLDGAGQTVAIIDAYASPTIVRDATRWSQLRGLPTPNIHQKVFPASGAIDPGWWAEETLDVEAVHGMAKSAVIKYIGGASNSSTDLEEAQNFAVENAVAPVVSNSYGYAGEVSQGIRQIEDAIFSAGAATGVGFFFSSGDNGDESITLGQATPDWPASSTNVTAVGGTSLATTAHGGYDFETYWGTDKSTLTGGVWTPAPPGAWLYGAGGGTSHVINEPTYQVGVVPTQFSSRWGGSHRVVPDISLDGDPNTGFKIGFTQNWPTTGRNKYSEYRIGGTSLSAPLMAGLMAVVNQNAGSPLGFINPALYLLYTNNPAAFRDVTAATSPVAVARVDFVNGYSNDAGTTVSLRTMDDTLTLSSIAGWDDATGPGSPNGMAFIDGLSNP